MDVLQKYKDFYLKYANINKAQFDRKLVNTKYQIKGVKTSDIENFVKELCKADIDLNKLPLNYHEDILIKGFLIAKKKGVDKEKELSALLSYIDNWATCDMIVARIKNSVPEDFFNKLLKDEKPFYKRVGIVWLKNNMLKNQLEKTLKQILQVEDDDYFVKMAQAWAVADGFAIDFEKSFALLKCCRDQFIVKQSILKGCQSFRVRYEQKLCLKQYRKDFKMKRSDKNAG